MRRSQKVPMILKKIINRMFAFTWTCVFTQVLMMDSKCDPVHPDPPWPPPPRRRWPSMRYVDWGQTGRGALAGPRDPAPAHLRPSTMFEHLPTALRNESQREGGSSFPAKYLGWEGGQCRLEWASSCSHKLEDRYYTTPDVFNGCWVTFSCGISNMFRHMDE